MMGHTHVVAGSALWLAIGPVVQRWSHQPVTLPELAVGVVVAGGSALLPDLDNHGMDCACRTFGILTEALDWGISRLARRHRGPTHSLLATAVVAVGAWEASRFRWGIVAVVFVLAGMALHVAGPRTARVTLCGQVVMAAAIAGAVWYRVPAGPWLPACVAVGYGSHIVIDMGNKQPVSWAWPLRLWPRDVHVTLVPLESMREYVGAAACSAFIIWASYVEFWPAVHRAAVIAATSHR